MKTVVIVAEEPDDNKVTFIAAFDTPTEQPRIVGNALIFTEDLTNKRRILPLSRFRLITVEPSKQVKPL